MPCNGKDHSASCECGWGGVWYGNIPPGGGGRFYCDGDPSIPRALSIHKLIEARKPRSLTIPNAKCPVCGCRVFFYQNEYGSRVFFDSLGPPWPKHPCTDNSWHSSSGSGIIAASGLEEEPPRRKAATEWRPYVIHRKDGPRLILKELEADTFIRLALRPEMLSSVIPVVYVREVSKRVLNLSYFHTGIRADRTISAEFERVVRRSDAAAKTKERSGRPISPALAQLPFNPALLTRADAVELSVRSANCLKNDNIVYVGDLVQKTEAEMLRTPNFGRKSLNEIKEVLAQMGLHLGTDVPDWPPENLEALAEAYAAGTY
jgi:hypothetical protein